MDGLKLLKGLRHFNQAHNLGHNYSHDTDTTFLFLRINQYFQL